jgi:DNA-directed RNA polymerase sigma subunit (sigma70/sigma32)
VRERIPVYLGAEGPKNVAMGAEICDGWIPMFLSPYRMMDMYADAMRIKNKDFEIAASVPVIVNDDVDRALAILPDRERTILTLRFGLDGNEPWTLDEIGAHFGLTRERIRQLQVEALRKLQRSQAARPLREYLAS